MLRFGVSALMRKHLVSLLVALWIVPACGSSDDDDASGPTGGKTNAEGGNGRGARPGMGRGGTGSGNLADNCTSPATNGTRCPTDGLYCEGTQPEERCICGRGNRRDDLVWQCTVYAGASGGTPGTGGASNGGTSSGGAINSGGNAGASAGESAGGALTAGAGQGGAAGAPVTDAGSAGSVQETAGAGGSAGAPPSASGGAGAGGSAGAPTTEASAGSE